MIWAFTPAAREKERQCKREEERKVNLGIRTEGIYMYVRFPCITRGTPMSHFNLYIPK